MNSEAEKPPTYSEGYRDGIRAGVMQERERAAKMIEACQAALAYDKAINKRAGDGDCIKLDVEGAIAEGADLDGLYMDWMTKARAALRLEAKEA